MIYLKFLMFLMVNLDRNVLTTLKLLNNVEKSINNLFTKVFNKKSKKARSNCFIDKIYDLPT